MSALGGLLLARDAMEVLDPGLMSRRLAPFLEDGDGTRVVAARVVSIAPGRRAVVAYETAGRRGPGPALVGKVYTEPGRALRLHDLLVRLDALGIGAPRPVAHLPALGMCVFTASPGRSLDRLAGVERRDGVVAAATWLAGLHGCGLELDRSLDVAAESRNLLVWGQEVTALHPDAAVPMALLLERVDALAGRIQPSGTVPIHKDYHYQHTLVEDGRVVVVDLDEARAGDPAFDVAHFTANLRLLGLREGTAPGGPDDLEPVFLDAYGSRTGYRPDDRHRYFHAYTCLKIARQLVRGRGPAPAPTGAELGRQLALILAEGLRCPAG